MYGIYGYSKGGCIVANETKTHIYKQARISGVKVSGQSGFTLIEVAIVLALVGIIVAGAAFAYPRYVYRLQVEATNKQLNTVMTVLSAYVQRNNRLPCPALPTGNGLENKPVTSTSGDQNCFDNTDADTLYENTSGVLPWRELGIPETMARDAWGRLITYKPAAQLTLNNNTNELQDTADADDLAIHNACRSPMWYTLDDAGSPQHTNRGKALFCCNATVKDAYQSGGMPSDWRRQSLRITGQNADQSMVLTPYWLDPRPSDPDSSGNTANYNGNFRYPHMNGFGPAGNVIQNAKGDSPLMRATTNAVTLISHGNNGFLAQILGTNALQTEDGPRISNAEIANAQDKAQTSGTIYNPKMSGNTYDKAGLLNSASDDIVAYIRSDQLYAKAGNASCQPNVTTHNCKQVSTSEAKPMQDVSYVLDKSSSMNGEIDCMPGSAYCGWTLNEIVDDAMAMTIPKLVELKLQSDPATTDKIQLSTLWNQQAPVAIDPGQGVDSITYDQNGHYTGTNATVAALQSQIGNLNTQGGSPVAQGVMNMLSSMGNSTDPDKPNVIVLMSDGSNNERLRIPCGSCPGGYTTYNYPPAADHDQALADSVNTTMFTALTDYIVANYPNVQIYSVQISELNGSGTNADKENMRNLAERTGGKYISVSYPDDLKDIFNSISLNTFLTCL